jgi:signal recognition particle GTPase
MKMKVKYHGNISPCKVKVKGIILKDWVTGEIREVPEHIGYELIQNLYFKQVDKKNKKQKKQEIKVEVQEELPEEIMEEEIEEVIVEEIPEELKEEEFRGD